jgi:hypothetical protein
MQNYWSRSFRIFQARSCKTKDKISLKYSLLIILTFKEDKNYNIIMLLVVNLGWRIIAYIILFLRSMRTKPSIGNFFRKLKQKKKRSAIK